MHRQEPLVGIVGGGIAGLSAAWQLRHAVPEANVVILEKSRRLGGRIETDSKFLVDHPRSPAS